MTRLLIAALTTATVLGLGSLGANACEKHLNGHQNSSDTNVEGSRR
jgi:beta-glucosidase-like glycosyl hydrolase